MVEWWVAVERECVVGGRERVLVLPCKSTVHMYVFFWWVNIFIINQYMCVNWFGTLTMRKLSLNSKAEGHCLITLHKQ